MVKSEYEIEANQSAPMSEKSSILFSPLVRNGRNNIIISYIRRKTPPRAQALRQGLLGNFRAWKKFADGQKTPENSHEDIPGALSLI